MKKLLIAIDDGPMAEKVASTAFEFAQQMKADMALVSIVDTSFLSTDGGISPAELVEIIKNDYRKSQALITYKIFGTHPVRTFVEEGKPHEVILHTALEWGADIIAMGTHGRKGIPRILLGSVAEKVIRHSPIPLFIIPAS